jgi:hypothetical protein
MIINNYNIKQQIKCIELCERRNVTDPPQGLAGGR